MTKSKNMLVSIVTPSYNQGRFLERTIRSVLDQDYPQIQYLVIDGGSTDESIEIIKRYQHKIDYWVSERDKGQTDAINKGFAHAKGEILAWINSDDTYKPGAFLQAVKFLEGHPEYAGVYADADFIDENDRKIGKFPAAQTTYHKLRRGYVHIPQQTFFFRRSFWERISPLDTSFNFAMDYDLWVRLAKLAPLKYLRGQNWASFRLHSDSKTILADVECWPEMLRVHYREGGSRFASIVFKYHLRKVVAPLLTLRRRMMFR
jgi:glycosyltransferase involved in cell wall biosynthesis